MREEADLCDLEMLGAKSLLNPRRVELMWRVAEGGRAQPNQHSSQIELTHLLIDFIHHSRDDVGRLRSVIYVTTSLTAAAAAATRRQRIIVNFNSDIVYGTRRRDGHICAV